MFTGIVEELGTIAEVTDQGDAVRLTVAADTVLEGTGLGDSISVNGCCLTVAEIGEGRWTADLMQETLDKTSLRGVAPGERATGLRAGADPRGSALLGELGGGGRRGVRRGLRPGGPADRLALARGALRDCLNRCFLVDISQLTC